MLELADQYEIDVDPSVLDSICSNCHIPLIVGVTARFKIVTRSRSSRVNKTRRRKRQELRKQNSSFRKIACFLRLKNQQLTTCTNCEARVYSDGIPMPPVERKKAEAKPVVKIRCGTATKALLNQPLSLLDVPKKKKKKQKIQPGRSLQSFLQSHS